VKRVGDHREYILARIRIEDRGHSTPCWIWQRGLTEKGYGDCRLNGRHTRSHRIAYAAFVGAIPGGLQIDHLCRIKACCNPAHLEPVTNEENNYRARGFVVVPEHCSRGHLNAENRDRHGNCRLCALHLSRLRSQSPEQRARKAAYMREWNKRQRQARRCSAA
jgi:hypothetical protein